MSAKSSGTKGEANVPRGELDEYKGGKELWGADFKKKEGMGRLGPPLTLYPFFGEENWRWDEAKRARRQKEKEGGGECREGGPRPLGLNRNGKHLAEE